MAAVRKQSFNCPSCQSLAPRALDCSAIACKDRPLPNNNSPNINTKGRANPALATLQRLLCTPARHM